MKRLLALAPAALLVLAGCGTDTCSSSAAHVAAADSGARPTCTLAPGSTATINVTLCTKCTDSSPGCQAEFRTDTNTLEVAPFVQQCQANLGCNINGCNAAAQQASCQVTIPAGASGTASIALAGDTQPILGTLTLGSGTSCSL